MRRQLLPLITLCLLLLVLADRVSEALGRHRAANEPVASETRSATPDLSRRSAGAGTATAAKPPDAGEARRARLAAREALTRLAV